MERSMDRDSARPNIDHFHILLANETDEAKRAVLRGLLAEEKANATLGTNNISYRKTQGMHS